MGAKSFAARLPKDLRDELDRLIAAGGLSVDDVWTWLRDREVEVGRSSVHRHMQSVEETAADLRRAREAAVAIVQQIGPEAAEGTTGQLLTEVVQTIAFKVAQGQLAQGGAGLDMESLMFLASTVQKLASAQSTDAGRILKIRRETASSAAKAAEKAAVADGVSAATVKAITHAVLGIAA